MPKLHLTMRFILSVCVSFAILNGCAPMGSHEMSGGKGEIEPDVSPNISGENLETLNPLEMCQSPRLELDIECLKKLAQAENSQAARILAVDYEYKHEIPKAIEWYEKAARKGDARAMARLSNIYEKTKEYKKADEWNIKAAQAGDDEAQYLLGRRYEKGIRIEVNFSEALRWYQKAEPTMDIAAFSLGKMYAEGKGVTKDPKKARKFFEEAVRHGYAPEHLNLYLPQGEKFPSRENESDLREVLGILLQGIVPECPGDLECEKHIKELQESIFKNCPRAVGYALDLKIGSIRRDGASRITVRQVTQMPGSYTGSGYTVNFEKKDNSWQISWCGFWIE